MKKHDLPTVANLNLKIDLMQLRKETDLLFNKFTDVRTANPMLCDNHNDLVNQVYDNFQQINLTVPEKTMPFTKSIKQRLKRKDEHLYKVPTKEYKDSYFEKIIKQCISPASRIRITKLDPGKIIPFHVDYNVNYAVRCICPIYSNSDVINLFKRNDKIESYNLKDGNAYFLNIGFPHAVVNISSEPRIALMFSLDGTDDIANL